MQSKNNLSDSECEAIVAFTVLAIVLKRLHPDVVQTIRKEAMTQFADIGDKYIISEAKEFFERALHQR